MSRKAVTLKDVAGEVGVSVNTVSSVLNPRAGKAYVAAATRAAVMKAAEKLGYRRNIAAARLTGCQTNTIGILMSSLINPLALPIVDAFEERAAGLGYQCFIGCTRHTGLGKAGYVEQFLSHGVDGLLLTTMWDDPEAEQALRTVIGSETPVAFIDTMSEKEKAALICGNHFQGGQLLARHLLELGHRRLGFLCDESQRHLYSIGERIRGVQEALAASGLKVARLELIWAATHRAADFAGMVHKALQKPSPPTAILCSGDLTAIELLIGLGEYGILPPRDLSVTGYDDIINPFLAGNLHLDHLAVPWRFPVTTVRQPAAQIGRKAADVLIGQIAKGAGGKRERHLLDVDLVVNGSTGPPKAGQRG